MATVSNGLLGRTSTGPYQSTWSVWAIQNIEDLSNAVLNAGLEAVQMTRGCVTGSLAFTERNGVVFSSGRLNSDVVLSGPLSEKHVTLGLALQMPPGTWHWQEPVAEGDVGVFHPGDFHDSRYRPGALYATITLSLDQLEAEAAKLDLALDRKILGGTSFRRRTQTLNELSHVRDEFNRVHIGQPTSGDPCDAILNALIRHCARAPRTSAREKEQGRHTRIVAQALDYVRANLHEPIRIEDIAEASMTSHRTLFRLFVDRMGEPPQHYVRRLRLHRIRHNLVSEEEAACTIAMISHLWGIGEPGRMSGLYRELFGELPSETLARQAHVKVAET